MWKESEHPRDEDGQFIEKEKAGKLLGINLTPVNTKKTGTSYYDNFLNEKDANYMQRNKNLKGDIQMISPQEYYEMCAKNVFDNTTADKLKQQRKKDESTNNLINLLKKGESLDMSMINLAEKSQEGMHRMMALGELYGWNKKQPVLIVDWYHKKSEEKNKKIEYKKDEKMEKLYDELLDVEDLL